MERVIAYIDGFNLYFGLRSKGWQRYYWLNVKELALRLIKPHQQLVGTKYFTARISGPPAKRKRQLTFLEALETVSDLEIVYGKYQVNRRQCRNCGLADNIPSEKMTDVNIAVTTMEDALLGKFDTALLITADADLTPVLRSIRRLCPNTRAVVAFPPGRYSAELAQAATSCFHIGRKLIAASQFPPAVVKADGFILTCPTEWQSKPLVTSP